MAGLNDLSPAEAGRIFRHVGSTLQRRLKADEVARHELVRTLRTSEPVVVGSCTEGSGDVDWPTRQEVGSP